MSIYVGIFFILFSYVSVGGRRMKTLDSKFKRLGEVKQGGVILILGIIGGVLFANIFKNLYWNQLDFLNGSYFSKIIDIKIEYNILLKYVLWKNYRTFILFWILCSTAFGIPYIGLSLLYCGFQGSFFVTTIFMKYGIKGILLLFGYTFPHYLIYIPVMFLCFRSGYWLCSSMYRDTRLNARGKLERITKHLVIIVLLGGVLLIGGLLETYVGSFLLKKILVLFH